MTDDPTPTPAPEEPDSAAPPEPPVDASPHCAECESPLEADQTYCLECGAPTTLAPVLRRRGAGTGALAAGLAVLGVGAGVLGMAVADNGGGGGSSTAPPTPITVPTAPGTTINTTSVPTGPLPPDTTGTPTTPGTVPTTTGGFLTQTSGTVTVPPTTTAPTTGGLPPDTTGGPTTATTDTTDTTDSGTVTPPDTTVDSQWPPGRSAWTAIIASASDVPAAQLQRSRARAAGYSARILLSDDHANLTPGLYVVFVGVYASRLDAVAMAQRARVRFPGSYARFVES